MGNYGVCGVHCVLYYCGIEHMLVNIYDYVNKESEEKELIYLHVEPELYKVIFESLHKEGFQIETFNIPHLMQIYHNEGIKCLADYFLDCERKAKDKGYLGIRVVNQVSYLLKKVSNEDFLDFENVLTEAVEGKNISIMCAYDFDDYINKKKFINDTLLEQSFDNHNYRFYKFKLMKNTRCI